MTDLAERVKLLSEIHGPVGWEWRTNEWLKSRWASMGAHDFESVPPGSLLAKVGGTGPRVVLVAHIDEIGFVVKSVTPEGLLTIVPSFPDRNGRAPKRIGLFVAGQPAVVLGEEGAVDGVFATVCGHAARYEQWQNGEIRWRDFWVDIGCGSAEEVRARGVLPGTPVLWNPAARLIGTKLIGKAMDDRAGIAILETVLAEVDPSALSCELWIASTAMEECNALGAMALGKAHSFDAAIVLDVGLSSDCPAVSEEDVPACLGDGAVAVVKDNAAHYDVRLIRRLERCSQAEELPLQRAVYGVDGSYASDGLRLIAQGIPTALLAFPTSYTHSPCEMVDTRDLRVVTDLLKATVTRWSEFDD